MQRFGEAEFSVGVDYRDKDQRSYFDFNNSPSSRADRLDLTSLTPRLKLPIRNHTLVVGADWHSWRYRSRRADRPENFERPANRVTVAQDTAGYYAQDTIDLSRATLVTLGWRSERAKYAGDDQADLTRRRAFSATRPRRRARRRRSMPGKSACGTRSAPSLRSSAAPAAASGS